MGKLLGISVATSVQTLGLVGVGSAGLLEEVGVTPADLQQTWVPWAQAARLFNHMEARLCPTQYPTFASLWLKRHPTLRVASQFAASTTAWLDLYWRLNTALHPAVECSYVMGPGSHRLVARLRSELEPSRLWFGLMHHQAVCAPELLGDTRLRVLSVDISGHGMSASYAINEATSAARRVKRSTDIPLTTIFSALDALRCEALSGLRDGHLEFDQARSPAEAERPSFADHFKLTPTEARVLQLLVEGLTPKELAKELGMTVGTARVHLKRLYAKTKSKGQRALVAQAERWVLR